MVPKRVAIQLTASILIFAAVVPAPPAEGFTRLDDAWQVSGESQLWWDKYNETIVVFKEVFESLDMYLLFGVTHLVFWEVEHIVTPTEMQFYNATPNGGFTPEPSTRILLREGTPASSLPYLPKFTWKEGCSSTEQDSGPIEPEDYQNSDPDAEILFTFDDCVPDANGDLYDRKLPLNLRWQGDALILQEEIIDGFHDADWHEDWWWCNWGSPSSIRYMEKVDADGTYVFQAQDGSYTNANCLVRSHVRYFEDFGFLVYGQAHYEHYHSGHKVHSVENPESSVGNFMDNDGTFTTFHDAGWHDNVWSDEDHNGNTFSNDGYVTIMSIE